MEAGSEGEEGEYVMSTQRGSVGHRGNDGLGEDLVESVSPLVEAVLRRANHEILAGQGRLSPRYPGEGTWVLQVGVMAVRVTLAVEGGVPVFVIGALGPPPRCGSDVAELDEDGGGLWEGVRRSLCALGSGRARSK
jgi:hypothetical protein